VGVQGGQSNFLSAAGYAKLGLPRQHGADFEQLHQQRARTAWHSAGAILRGILSKATTPVTAPVPTAR